MAEMFDANEVDERFTPKGRVDEKRRQATLGAQALFLEHAGELTEAISRFMKGFCQEHEMSMEEGAGGVALLCCNMREFFPKELGGPAKFDEIASGMQDYFDKEKGK